MKTYLTGHPQDPNVESFEDVSKSINGVAREIMHAFEDRSPEGTLRTDKYRLDNRPHVKKFSDFIWEDLSDCWMVPIDWEEAMWHGNGNLLISTNAAGATQGRKKVMLADLWEPELYGLLEAGRPEFEPEMRVSGVAGMEIF